MKLKTFTTVFLLMAIVSFGFWQRSWLLYSTMSPGEKLSVLWKQDTEILKEKDLLPAPFEQIRSFEITKLHDREFDWLHSLSPPISFNSLGGYHLEVDLLPLKHEESFSVVINYHLVELASGNTVWELGRTFDLGPLSIKKE